MNSKIQNILDNKNLFINISNENYKKIKNNYLVANIAEKEIEMYKKLVKWKFSFIFFNINSDMMIK